MSRLRPMRWIALAIVVAAIAGAAPVRPQPATAAAPCAIGPITSFLAADATRPGVIDLYFFGARGQRVSFFECVRGSLRRLGAAANPDSDATLLHDATTWRCDRPARRFVASATLPDGTPAAGAYSVRTGSCARRLEIDVRRRAPLRSAVRVRVVDRWEIGGIRPQLCVAAPRARYACRTVALRAGVTVATRRVRANIPGRWRIELRLRGRRMRAAIAVGAGIAAAPPAPTLLATGDSTMQGVDSFLADELGDRARVRSDVRPGTAISKRDGWLAYARAQTRRVRPRTTVISIGAAEGFPLRTGTGAAVECCGEPWVAAYAGRVRRMMRIYRRGGHARVIWLTLALPRGTLRLPIANAVNAAIVRAGAGLSGVRVLRMDLLFSPGGFREVIRYRGREIPVRTPDGIHLNVPGTAIEARAIAAALREP